MGILSSLAAYKYLTSGNGNHSTVSHVNAPPPPNGYTNSDYLSDQIVNILQVVLVDTRWWILIPAMIVFCIATCAIVKWFGKYSAEYYYEYVYPNVLMFDAIVCSLALLYRFLVWLSLPHV